MAFDRPDTDQLYTSVLQPALRDNGITPVIINRRQSNQDLNNQIVEQLESSDFCIADLTYTRPSVYFEAGYAQRAIPVIYTVRADHLNGNQPDDLRVHFDLQMKPLLRWADPLDPKFRISLVRRLRATVLRDWSRAQRATEDRHRERAKFESLSVTRRLVAMRREAVLAFGRLGFPSWAPHGSGQPQASVEAVVNLHAPLISELVDGRGLRIAAVIAVESLTAAVLREIQQQLVFWRSRSIGPNGTALTRVQTHIICMSLRDVPASRVEKQFDNYARGDREGRFVHDAIVRDRRIGMTTTIDVLGEVRSLEELKTELASVLDD